MLDAWKNSREDMGLGKISLIILAYDLFLFIVFLFYPGHFSPQILLPCLFALFALLVRGWIIRQHDLVKTLFSLVLAFFFCLYNYDYIGKLDQIVNFHKLDFFFAQFDMLVFGMPVSEYLGRSFPFNTSWGAFFNDLLIIDYILFYFFGIFAVVGTYLNLSKRKKYRVGIVIVSYQLFLGINYLFYILVPVSGPQYYQKAFFTDEIPFHPIGQFWFDLIIAGQSNFIDCFPSGHFGLALLTALWAKKMGRIPYYICIIISVLMFLATLRLRYHYTLDLLFSPFLVILAYLMSFKLFSRK